MGSMSSISSRRLWRSNHYLLREEIFFILTIYVKLSLIWTDIAKFLSCCTILWSPFGIRLWVFTLEPSRELNSSDDTLSSSHTSRLTLLMVDVRGLFHFLSRSWGDCPRILEKHLMYWTTPCKSRKMTIGS